MLMYSKVSSSISAIEKHGSVVMCTLHIGIPFGKGKNEQKCYSVIRGIVRVPGFLTALSYNFQSKWLKFSTWNRTPGFQEALGGFTWFCLQMLRECQAHIKKKDAREGEEYWQFTDSIQVFVNKSSEFT